MEHARSTAMPQMSETEFLDWAGTQDGRFELFEGTVMMQAGATRNHERVAKRVFKALYDQVDESTFDVNKGDFGVRISPGTGKGTILYPDVLVDLQSDRGGERATTTPLVVVEVLSESTDYEEHRQKLEKYKRRDTLKQYVVYEQDKPLAYVWNKTDAGWPAAPQRVEGMEAAVSFPWVGASVSMAEVFRSTEPRSEHIL